MEIDANLLHDDALAAAIAYARFELDELPVGEERQRVNERYIAMCEEQMRRKLHRKVPA